MHLLIRVCEFLTVIGLMWRKMRGGRGRIDAGLIAEENHFPFSVSLSMWSSLKLFKVHKPNILYQYFNGYTVVFYISACDLHSVLEHRATPWCVGLSLWICSRGRHRRSAHGHVSCATTTYISVHRIRKSFVFLKGFSRRSFIVQT